MNQNQAILEHLFMSYKTYYEKLKDPRWQKKRLEVLQNYDFTCQRCEDTKSTLHVHHKEYFKGIEPWDYSNDQLTVLCESCHESSHDFKDILKYVSSLLSIKEIPNDRDSVAFLIAGYVGLDYDDVIKDSSWEHCPFTYSFYKLGKHTASQARKYIKDELKSFRDGGYENKA